MNHWAMKKKKPNLKHSQVWGCIVIVISEPKGRKLREEG